VLQGIDVLLGMCGALCRVFYLMALEMYTKDGELRLGPFTRREAKKALPVWGKWEPGSADKVGRHGPTNLAGFEEGERMTFALTET